MTFHDSPSPHHGLAVPVDPARAEALRARLHDELVGRVAQTPTTRSPAAERQEFTVHSHPPERRAHRMLTMAAILVAVAGLVGVVVIATRDGASTADEQPGIGASPASTVPGTRGAATTMTPTTPALSTTDATTSPPTTVPPTTEAEPLPRLPPLPDDEIASAALPRRTGEQLPEYGERWQSAVAIHAVEMRGDIAAAVPECAPFLDAFESSGRPAVVDVELAWHPDPPAALSSTYIVVFPDEFGAEAMFDATRDPRFIRQCSPAYDQELYDVTGQSLSQSGYSYFPYYNDRPVPGVAAGETYTDLPPIDVDVDEQWAVQLNHTTDTFQVTTLRIGRVIAVVQGSLTARILGVDETGRAVAESAVIQTEGEYHAILRAVVQRTRDALAGIAPAQAG